MKDLKSTPFETLEALGWSEFFERQHLELREPDWRPARVALANRGHYVVIGTDGETSAVLSGRVRHGALQRAALPAVGDWVAARRAADATVVEHRFERRTTFERAGVGGDAAQVVAANVDTVLIVTSFNRDLNARRLERYLTVIWDGGADPVIVINKADLVGETRSWLDRLGPVASGLPVLIVSAIDGRGVERLRDHLGAGRTVALVGSSGVGKSTLINRLLGEERQAVRASRDVHGKGRHTTTHRELLWMPGGGWLVDTPGMRELGLVGDDDGLETAFEDVEALAAACRFRDCEHDDEPGCAVRSGIERGELPVERLESYRKLKRELAYARRKQDASLAREERLRWKKIHVANRKRLWKRS